MLTRTTFRRFLLAAISGLLSYFAFPSPGFWPIIFISIAGLYLALRGVKFWLGALIGLVGGFCYYASQIYWISQYLGPEPLIALAGLEGLIFAVSAGVIALVTRRFKSPLVLAAFSAVVWTGREWLATHAPYGGFPWSRVAMSQADSPLSFWVSLGGFGLLSFVIVLTTVFITETLLSKSKIFAVGSVAVIAVLFLVPLTLSIIPVQNSGTLRIVGIQGNANAGLFANETRGTVLQNHLDETASFLKTGKRFDLMVWPENASDINPGDDETVSSYLQQLIDNKIKAPLIFGTITHTENDVYNSSELWLPRIGQVDQYDKKRPVPFGEYVPDRKFFYQIAPDLVGLLSRGYSFGTRDGIFKIDRHKIGILICFEEAIDELPRDVVSAGAQVIVAQTNNADFGHSDESVQQLAIARLRAIETGRAIVNVSTVGPSAIIDAHGKTLSSTKAYVPGYVLSNVPLSNQKTLTMLGGWMFDPAAAILAGLISVWLIVDNRRKTTKL